MCDGKWDSKCGHDERGLKLLSILLVLACTQMGIFTGLRLRTKTIKLVLSLWSSAMNLKNLKSEKFKQQAFNFCENWFADTAFVLFLFLFFVCIRMFFCREWCSD